MSKHTFVRVGDIRMLIKSKRIVLVAHQEDDDTFVVGWFIDKSGVMSFAKWSSGGLETISISLS